MGRVKEIWTARTTMQNSSNTMPNLSLVNVASPTIPDWMTMHYPIAVDSKLQAECLHKISFKKLSKFMPKGYTELKTPYIPDFCELRKDNFKPISLLKLHFEEPLHDQMIGNEQMAIEFD